MNGVENTPSLLSFVLARLTEDRELVIGHAPVAPLEGADRHFHDRFLDRRALYERVRHDETVVAACVEAMREVQGPPPVPVPSEPHPVTTLGSQVIKLIAARYADHRDYDPAWAPN